MSKNSKYPPITGRYCCKSEEDEAHLESCVRRANLFDKNEKPVAKKSAGFGNGFIITKKPIFISYTIPNWVAQNTTQPTQAVQIWCTYCQDIYDPANGSLDHIIPGCAIGDYIANCKTEFDSFFATGKPTISIYQHWTPINVQINKANPNGGYILHEDGSLKTIECRVYPNPMFKSEVDLLQWLGVTVPTWVSVDQTR